MAQNIYDQSDFFAGYSRLPRQVEGLDGAPEWPAIRALMPPMQGKRVLDLGCGFGWFCRWARGEGAASALGIDLSERMLERARHRGDFRQLHRAFDERVAGEDLFDQRRSRTRQPDDEDRPRRFATFTGAFTEEIG